MARSYALAMFQNKLLERFQDQTNAITSGEWNTSDPTDEQDRAGREMETLAAIFKATASTHANRTLQVCREACGGAGFMSENLLTTFRADVDVFTTFEGDDTILRQLVGKNLLTAYGREVSEMSPFGMARYVASNIGDILTRRSGIAASVATRAAKPLPVTPAAPFEVSSITKIMVPTCQALRWISMACARNSEASVR